MTHKSRIGVIVIDCRAEDLAQASAFWSQALGYEAQPDAKFPNYVMLRTPAGEPRVLLQAVEHDSRIHLDIETDDKQAEAARLEALGAVREGDVKNWTIMRAPTGHRFCLVDPQRADFRSNATTWSAD
jgi:predicted enzyme related to lactoylglutathione lyase